MKWFTFLMFLPLCLGHLDVYLSSAEVLRLLGLTAELYYVRDGQINHYALNFVVPVPATIGELHFTWQSLQRRPLPYTLHVEVVSHPEAMHPPTFNISSAGFVPTEPQTWRVDLPCTHTVAAEVDITISLNVSTGSSSTALHFRRRKICLKDVPRPAVRVDTVPHAPTSADIFYAGAGCAGGVLLIAGVAAAACRARARKLRRTRSDEQDAHAFLPDSSCKSAASYTSYRRPTSIPAAAAEERARDLQQRIAELTIQRCRVRLRSVAMEGTFGRVYRGTYADEDGREQEVLVKTVAEHASQVQVSLLLQEGCMLYGLRHERILSVLGVSIEDQTAPFLLYPWGANLRNLKQFLLACRGVTVGGAAGGAPPPPPLTTQHVVRMALHALDGLLYLHTQHVLHKDVAARNCTVDENLRVMIADNALSRDLFPADYHCLGDNENRPIKWMALEGLTKRQFSPAADVWALGVLMWELTTLAHQPYAEVDPFEVAAYLRDGYRLQQPANCPDELLIMTDNLYPSRICCLYAKWDSLIDKVIKSRPNIKDKVTLSLITELQSFTANEEDNKKNDQIKLLCHLIPPRGRLNQKTKFSILECQEGFVVHVQKPGDISTKIEEITTKASQNLKCVQPYILYCGNEDNYKFYLVVDKIRFAVMAYCWAMSPDDRPTLTQLQIFLRDFHTQLTRFV